MNSTSSSLKTLKALGNEKRLQILQWLLKPRENFPPQVDGDLVDDGVCVGFITRKIDLKQPTVTAHMQTLQDAGLVSSKQIKNWVFYKPDRVMIAKALQLLARELDVQ
ncbi:MAG: helix-turn-helix transcriptional regulator [Rhizobiaceae bacterium]|nr:helix-turn-helix transcriptional regulator [Rhizobiaceae bacterium]